MRAIEEVQKEYASMAAQFGDLKYKIVCFEDEAAKLVEKMKALNQEGAEIQKAAAEAKTPEVVS